MFSKLVEIVKRPYSLFESRQFRIYFILIPSVFVALFILMFKPFGFGRTPFHDVFPLAMLYGGITAVVLFVNLFLIQPLIIKKFTIGKTLLWNTWILISIGLTNAYVVLMVFNNGNMLLSYFLIMQSYTLSLGTIISLFMMLIHYNYILKSKIRCLSESVTESTNTEITFSLGINQKPLTIPVADLYYIKSADNYVDIHYNGSAKLGHRLIRMTLKQMEQQLATYPEFKRCHRSYIINTRYIKCIKSSISGYKIEFTTHIQQLPLSRNYKRAIEKAFTGS